MIKYAECKMQATVGMTAKPLRKKFGGVSMVASPKMHPSVAGMGLTLKPGDIETAARLLMLFGKTDEELAQMLRESALAPGMEGKSDTECANYIRDRALVELKAFQKKVKDG
jgi:hypothetical protein